MLTALSTVRVQHWGQPLANESSSMRASRWLEVVGSGSCLCALRFMAARSRWAVLGLTGLAAVIGSAAPVAAQTEVVEYYGLDAVGSVRIVFDASGTIKGRIDYGPFGQELSGGTNMPDRRYAGLFRDGEAGLDSAGARSYQSRTGRFSTTDAIYAGLFEPQRWNRYAYVHNNPLGFTDTSGLSECQYPLMGLPCFGTTNNPAGGQPGSPTGPGPTTDDPSSRPPVEWWEPGFGTIYEPDWLAPPTTTTGGDTGGSGTGDAGPVDPTPSPTPNPNPNPNPEPMPPPKRDALSCSVRWGFSTTARTLAGDGAGRMARVAEIVSPFSLLSDGLAMSQRDPGLLELMWFMPAA
jgi:RHS repeat-associated protein